MTEAAPFISHNLSRITREFMDVFVQGFFVRMINHSQANLATVSSKSTNNRGSVIIISPMASLLVGSASGRIVFIKMLFPFFAGILKHLIGFGDGIFQRGSWLNLNRSLMKFSADGKKRLATESNFPGNCRRRLSFADAAKEKYGLGGAQLLVSKDRSTVEVIDNNGIYRPSIGSFGLCEIYVLPGHLLGNAGISSPRGGSVSSAIELKVLHQVSQQLESPCEEFSISRTLLHLVFT